MLLPTWIFAVCLSLAAFGQNTPPSLKNFTWTLPGEVTFGLVYLNDSTTPIIFEPPTLYSIRARSHTNTMFYVQGTPDKNVQIDTTNFIIEQNGETVTSLPTNIKHFEKGKPAVPKGERVEGLLTFTKLVNVSQPFIVKHGEDSVQIRFNSDQIKATTPATADPEIAGRRFRVCSLTRTQAGCA
jgi:hypothetical protein